MNILLVMPSSLVLICNSTPNNYKKLSPGHYPPLGLMYIGGYLEKNSHHRVEILDMAVEGVGYEELKTEILRRKPEAVGIYTTSWNIYHAYRVAQEAKAVDDKMPIILGGPHVDIYPKETLNLPCVDYLVLGEGEVTLKELLDALEGRTSDFSQIPGIAYKRNSQMYITQMRPFHHSLDSLPFPARRLVPYNRYYSLLGTHNIDTTIIATRGCPYGCNFCYVKYGKTFRARSAKNVADELEECVEMGIKEFFFVDENFTLNKKDALAICDEIINRKLRICYSVRSRVNTIDENLMERLKESGCQRIRFGVESGTQEILRAMNKNITLEQVRKVFRMAKEVGLPTYADFMIGYPGENLEQIMRTIDFALELDPDFVQFGVTTLYPRTRIYQDALEKGFIKDVWREMAANPQEEFVPPIASETFSREELERLHRLAYTRFYIRPTYILKRLSKTKSVVHFFRQARVGYHILMESVGN